MHGPPQAWGTYPMPRSRRDVSSRYGSPSRDWLGAGRSSQAGRGWLALLRSGMVRDRKTVTLLSIAGLAFLIAGLLSDPPQPLRFVAAAAFLLAALLQHRRSRRI